MKRAAACAASMAAITVVQVGAPNVGASQTAPEHCVVHVDPGSEAEGPSATPTDCYPTLAEALEAAGGVGGTATKQPMSGARAASSSVLAVHFDGTYRGGESLVVSGAACDATMNLASVWTDRISSTWNLCGTVRFFDDFNKGGASETTGLSTENLGVLNNRAASVYYGT